MKCTDCTRDIGYSYMHIHVHRSLAQYVIRIRDGNRTELEPNRTSKREETETE